MIDAFGLPFGRFFTFLQDGIGSIKAQLHKSGCYKYKVNIHVVRINKMFQVPVSVRKLLKGKMNKQRILICASLFMG